MVDSIQGINNPVTPIYSFIHRKFLDSAFRKNPSQLSTNALLLTRTPDLETRHNYMEEYQEGLYVADFSFYDKREIE